MKINFKNILIALIEKEFKSYLRSINNFMNMIVFMIAIIILFPLTVGPSEEKLTLVSNAIVWIAIQTIALETRVSFSSDGPTVNGNKIMIAIIKTIIFIKLFIDRK